jgi:hypothetical protein
MHVADLTPSEIDLVDRVVRGNTVDGARLGEGRAEPDAGDGHPAANRIRGWVLSALVTGEVPQWHIHPRAGLRLRGVHVVGPVELDLARIAPAPLEFEECTFSEGISITGAQVGTMRVSRCTLDELQANELESDGSMYIEDCRIGRLSLIDVRLRGVVTLARTTLTGREGVGLAADRLQCAGVLLREVETHGEMRLVGAKISGALELQECSMRNGVGAALTAEGCLVEGPFFLQLSHAPEGEINLAYAKVNGPLIDTMASWPGRIRLAGFTYRSLEGENTEPRSRIGWLRRSEPFTPDIYSQLATVYRGVGQEDWARMVAIARERDRSRRGNMGPWTSTWRRFLGVTVGYGYRPWRAVVPLVVLVAIATVLYALPAGRRVMAATNPEGPVSAAVECRGYPCFTPPMYALDVLLPVVDFHQETQWYPRTDRRGGWLYAYLNWFLIATGWILTGAVVAGFGSVWRKE